MYYRILNQGNRRIYNSLNLKEIEEVIYKILISTRRWKIVKMQLYSKATTGKWAAILTLLFIALIAIKFSALDMLIRLPLPTLFLAIIGVVGFLLGIISIVKNKDRAILTLLSIPIGLLIILWTAAEIIFPH